jgi:hypothetical protein
MIVTLSKALTIGEGDQAKAITELDLKLDDLTGSDVEICVREASAAKGESVKVLVIDADFHLQIASKASGVPVGALRRLGARDYVEVLTTVQGFLTGSV